MTVHSLWNETKFLLFAECLESLPNLHTLAVGRTDSSTTDSLKNALKRRKFPQIKALILPPSAYPLLKCCHNAEGVDCVDGDRPIHTEKLPELLASIRGSKVKRLAIPLVSSCDTPSKWSATLWGHGVGMMTDHPRPQDTSLRIRGSPNSPSSTLTRMRHRSRKRRSCLATWLNPHAPQHWNWSTCAKGCRISIQSRLCIFSPVWLLTGGDGLSSLLQDN